MDFRLLSILLLAGSSVCQAEIYKCTSGGKTVFSDQPCGEEAEIIDVSESTKKTGTQFSNDEMQSLGNSMGKERRQEELDLAISRQEREIQNIIDSYTSTRARLDEELTNHRSSADRENWHNHPYKKDKYYKKDKQIRDQIDHVYRQYRADREKAYNRLASLKKQRRNIR